MTAFDLVVRDEVFLRDKFDISACIESALAWQQTDPLGGVAKQLNTQQQQLANAYRGALFGDLSKKALASSDGAAALYPLCCSSVGCVANDCTILYPFDSDTLSLIMYCRNRNLLGGALRGVLPLHDLKKNFSKAIVALLSARAGTTVIKKNESGMVLQVGGSKADAETMLRTKFSQALNKKNFDVRAYRASQTQPLWNSCRPFACADRA